MLNFIGKYDAKLDVKGRVFVPSSYRKLLSDKDKECLVLRRDPDNKYLVLYPVSVWEDVVNQLKSSLDEWDSEDKMLLMQFVSDAEWLDIDSQGRILVSKRNLQNISAEGSDMIFVGMLDRIAIWSKSAYEQAMLPNPDFSSLLKSKMVKKTQI